MSSETSTERQQDSLQAWQLFTLAGLIGATVVVFLSRGQSPAAIILLSCSIFAAAYIGAIALRTFLPLAGVVHQIAPETLGDRARAALEREKALVLRSIKELEFDRGMGKVSEKDFAEMAARLRARAARLMQQLDAGSPYREQIEKDVQERLAATGIAVSTVGPTLPGPAEGTVSGPPERTPSTSTCASCNGVNDPDARFCKNCGARLEATS